MSRWMSRLNRLPVRLFLWLWLALVLAHYLGYAVQTWWSSQGPPPMPPGLMALPPADGLPPPGSPPPPGSSPPPGRHSTVKAPPEAELPRQMGADLVDYAVRVLVFGLVAATAARWVSRPLSRLHDAAGQLERQALVGQAPVPVPEDDGPQEVRELAAAYNRMSQRLIQQFDERSMMMAAVSHDLRTPLTRMRLRLEQPDSPERSLALLADLARMDSLIEQVLQSTCAERHAGQSAVLALASFVQSCVDDHVEAGRPVSWEAVTVSPLDRAAVDADPLALRRVLDNLIDNAVRHGHSARVSLAVGDGGNWLVQVDDEGPGIPAELLEHVMQPFARLDRARSMTSGGAGLGLYIARQLAVRHGGALSLANRPTGGLRATLRWPASDAGHRF